ncbi:hypothetical protein SAMN06265349_102828 [Flavobacterium resistens]|uniref:Uncharacterized protein n=1 Tax=Flavobacterium resistens TaxID=443612 RepID=A0A521CSC3_9FLAO|nr:hypothetical protein [Flavobacterium resistens]MRX66901.1 hypothetical protein [Flavobacterium resistens]SMO62364.1 hypothetical protein SAMN06265349_102828 [Flavobacterium resistens]
MRNLNNVPKIILQSKSVGYPIDFKWNNKKMEMFLDPLEGNEELETILSQISHKACIGLTAALLEWFSWRFNGYSMATNDIQKRIEALWCSVRDSHETDPLLFDTELDIPDSGSVNGPLWVALMNVRMIDVRYRKGSYFLQSELIGLVLLARYITPKKKFFDKWLDQTITALLESYPCTYNSREANQSDEDFYDSSDETVICREFFFDSKFHYTPEACEAALNNFINNLDHKANPFLHLSKKAS